MSDWNSDTAEWYAKKYGEYATNQLGIASLSLSADAIVVDIGCGTGSALRHASKIVTTGTLIGIDPIARMVEIAKENTIGHAAADRIEYFQAGAESLPVKDAFVDWVLAFDSYDHWQDQQAGLSEVRRVLKSEGKFVVLKDGGLPSGDAAKTNFLSDLEDAGFKVVEEKDISENDVSFTLWKCVVNN